MKIAYLIPSLKKCGPVNVMASLATALAKDHEVYVYALNSGALLEPLRKSGIITEVVSYREMFLVAISSEYDVIHSHCLLPDIILSFASLFKYKENVTCTTIHNFIDVDYILSKGRILGKVMGIVNRLAFSGIKVKIACSESVKEYCKSKYKIEAYAICNGVERQNIPLMKDRKIKEYTDFYYLGVVNARKNVEPLLYSFTEYVRQGNNDRLHIIGEGPDLHILKKKYKSGNVLFHGKQENPLNIIKNYDCYVSASKAEGCPLALLESLSLGNNYICSDIPPHQEIHQKIGEGVIVSVKHPDELVKAFEKINYINQHENKKKSILEKFENNFSTEIMVGKYKKIYFDNFRE
ncbi:glycosyltransferase [Salmonella enterica subsp. houtenae]|nr:glycosyltransferase [Salmonella enterica subsp. houtenae]